MTKYKEDGSGLPNDISRGIEGIFRGLGGVMKVAAELTEKTEGPAEVSRTRSIGAPGGVQASYGLSVRIGAATKPVMRRQRSFSRPSEAGAAREDIREPITDIFDEGDHYLIVAELPGLEEAGVRWNLARDTLVIDGAGGVQIYHKELLLPSAVNEQNATSSFKNGILELRLWKS